MYWSRDQFSRICHDHREPLRAFIRNRGVFCPFDTEDVLQEVHARAWKSRMSFDAAYDVGAWLTGIARNVAREHYRGWVREVPYQDPFGADGMRRRSVQGGDVVGDGVAASIDDHEMMAVLEVHLRRLGADDHRTVVLWAAGRSYESVAAELDVPVGTVKSRVNRIIRRLRSAIVDGGGGEG